MNRVSNVPAGLLVVLSLFVFTIGAPAIAEEPIEISLGLVALNVPDIAAAEAYYTDVIGFERTGSYPPDGKNVIEIFMRPKKSAPGSGATLALARLNDKPLPEGKSRYGRIIINTPKARELAARAVKAGATLREVTIPGDNPPVIIFFHDPNGYEIELYQAPK